MEKDKLADLLKEAEKAHALYEESLGKRDDDWHKWYANYIIKKLEN